MSALGSSVINKSGKKFGPKKAPIRRSAATETVSSRGQHAGDGTSSQPPPTRISEPVTALSPTPSLSIHGVQSTRELHDARESSVDLSGLPPRASPSSSRLRRLASPRQGSPPPTASRNRRSEIAPDQVEPVQQEQTVSPGRLPQPINNGETSQEQRGSPRKRRRTGDACEEENSSRNVEARRKSSRNTTDSLKRKTAPVSSVDPTTTEELRGSRMLETNTLLEIVQLPPSSHRTTEGNISGPNTASSRPSRRKATALTAKGNADPKDLPVRRERRRTKKTSRQGERRTPLREVAGDIVQTDLQDSSGRKTSHGRKGLRHATPENMRHVERDTDKVKLSDLCSEDRVGQISAREMQLRAMDHEQAAERARKDLAKLTDQHEVRESSEIQAGEAVGPSSTMQEMEYDVPSTIIDAQGDIVVNPEASGIDRHANAANERGADPLPTVEENELSRKVTSGRWLKRDSSSGWNGDLSQRFYDGLQMFGTDFEMISRMFPGKSRRAIKLKFCREEKLNNEFISATLLGEKIEIDLAMYEDMSQRKYKEPAEIERMMEEDRRAIEEQQAEELRAREAAEEQEREDVATAEDSDAEEGWEQDKSAPQKETGKSRKSGSSSRSNKKSKGRSPAASRPQDSSS